MTVTEITHELTDAEIAEGQRIFAGECDFMLGVADLSQLPPAEIPEIAFVGRSNVGKSSLVNALTNRKILARVSHTPGRTQQLNFFNLGDLLHLVDMPGYGYAKVSKSDRKAWNFLIKDYLRGRETLRCVFILIDSRHGLKDSDREMMKMLDECAVPYRIILTKTDKCKNLEGLKKSILAELQTHAAAFNEVYATSSHKKTGIEHVRSIIVSLCSV